MTLINIVLLYVLFMTHIDVSKCGQCNLALYKPTTSNCYNQSEPCMAVDDDMNSTFISCLSDNPWWQVDLQSEYSLSTINITYDTENIDDITISTSKEMSSDGTLLGDVLCLSWLLCNRGDDNSDVRYIRVTKNLSSTVLHIKEVQVYEKTDSACLSPPDDWICGNVTEGVDITGVTDINGVSEPTVISNASEVNEVVSEHCLCPCSTILYNATRIYTDEELQQKIEKLVEDISIDKKSTSVSKRKLISAPDHRPSAIAVGSMGVVILSLLALGIVAMDASRLVCIIHKHLIKRKSYYDTQ